MNIREGCNIYEFVIKLKNILVYIVRYILSGRISEFLYVFCEIYSQ